MAKSPKPSNEKTQKKPRVSRRNLWFSYFTDSSNKRTFLNRKESVRAAGYKTKNEESLRVMGHQNFLKLTDKINIWLDEVGLSENTLKMKLVGLMDARETKFQTMKGAVDKEQLPVNVNILATTGKIETDEDGEHYGSGDTLLAIEVDAIETQRRSLDMAIKVKGVYAAEKREHTGPDGEPLHGNWTINVVMAK